MTDRADLRAWQKEFQAKPAVPPAPACISAALNNASITISPPAPPLADDVAGAVERLRHAGDGSRDRILTNAADMLERLARELAETREALSAMCFWLGVGSGDESTATSKLLQRIQYGIEYYQDRLVARAEKAEAEVARMREVEKAKADHMTLDDAITALAVLDARPVYGGGDWASGFDAGFAYAYEALMALTPKGTDHE